MLGLHKQPNDSCLAYALWNAGIVDGEAVQEYLRMISMAEQLQTVGMFFPELQPELQVGSWPFAAPWIKSHINNAGLRDAIAQGYVDLLQTSIRWQFGWKASDFPNLTVPANGHGIIFMTIPNQHSGHAVAWEDGVLFDSSSVSPGHPETWEQFVARRSILPLWGESVATTVINAEEYGYAKTVPHNGPASMLA